MRYYTYIDDPVLKDRNLGVSPAGQSKSLYIIPKLKSLGKKITVVTLARTRNNGVEYPAICQMNSDGIEIAALKDKAYQTGLKRYIYALAYHIRVFSSFLKQGKEEVTIVYHSLMHAVELCVAKRLCGFKLILELEEIYQDVVPCGRFKAYWERKVIEVADGYILATEALSKVIPQEKPYIVINGTYHAEPDRHVSFNDKKIHCIYAGTFDPTKGGAAAAAAAAEFLPENYHVHILGFGTEEQTENLKKQIAEVPKKAKCTLTYDGLKSGEEYIQFLQKCQIGLCTQIPDAKYTETSFPSKVLVYLANGLRVLSVRIPAVEQSSVGDMLYYYDEQKPEKIAEAIQSIDMNLPYDSRERLEMLDIKATKDIQELLKEI